MKNKIHNHRQPITRRDFLAQGGLSFSAGLFAPNMLTKMLRANATSCAAGSASNFVPYLVIDCNGGAAFPGNWLVGGHAGPKDLLKSYDTLGWDPRAAGAVDARFGLPMAAKASQIFAGIIANISPEAQANFRMGSFCHSSQDDSSINSTSAIVLALEQGVSGSIVQRGLGTGSNLSGGNTGAVDQSSNYQPIVVSSINDVLNAVSMGPALSSFAANTRRDLIQSILGLSQAQLANLTNGAPGAFADQMSCAYQNVAGYADIGKVLDPRNDTNMSQVYKLDGNTQIQDANLVSAGIVMNVLKKQSGPGVITINGCDYHNDGQVATDAIDLSIGVEIGRAVEAAHLLKSPLFIQILTDGGVFAQTGTREWGGDSGDKGMTVIGYYNPNKTPQLISPDAPQIGAYNQGQAADQSTIIGADTGKVAYATLVNYLQICGTLGANADIFTNVFGSGNLDQVLLFGA